MPYSYEQVRNLSKARGPGDAAPLGWLGRLLNVVCWGGVRALLPMAARFLT